ncbi:MAG: UbiA family prenyltransferase [bacterium]|nr:UbiA family prenyltransferase [bacterium]MDZ4231458.1 UbiA family prenyltransferase [Patescibacteria group bacterium]
MVNFFKKTKVDDQDRTVDGEPIRPVATHARSALKVYVLIGTNTFLALIVGSFFKVQSFGYGMLFLVVSLSFLIVQTLTLKYVKEGVTASALCALGFMAPFLGEPILYFLPTLGLIWLLLAHAHNQGREYINNMVKIRFTRAARPVVGALLTAVVLLMTFVLFVNGESLLKEDNIGRTIDIMVTPVAKGYLEGFSSEVRLKDVLDNIAREEISKAPEAAGLSAAQINVLVDQSRSELLKFIEDKTGFAPAPNESVKRNVTMYVQDKSEDFSGTRAPLGALVLFAILFLLIKGIELVLYLPLALLAYMLYELAIAFGFIVVQFEGTSKEVINLT